MAITYLRRPSGKKLMTEDKKISAICDLITQLNYTPKSFLQTFLQRKNMKSAVQRRFWGTRIGWPTTLVLLKSIRGVIVKKPSGRQRWEDFILAEATGIVEAQKPPRGAYPKGAYHNTKNLSPYFFSSKSKRQRTEDIKDHMPFLFELLVNKMGHRPGNNQTMKDGNDLSDCDSDSAETLSAASEDDHYMFSGKTLNGPKKKSSIDHGQRARMTASTMCSMAAFVSNRRHNGHQLANSISFLACGVTDRVSKFLQYVGLSSSRQTAHNSLHRLSKQAERRIATKIGRTPPNLPTLAPFLCFDNLDFEQRIHTQSIGHSTHMFHGTWGYVHQINQALLDSVPKADLTLASYKRAMSNISKLEVTPKMFIPKPPEDEHWEFVLKSQIARTILEHIAQPSDSQVSIAIQPPMIDQLPADEPDITMLKLMVASDNSSQGVGEVFEAIVNQSSISMTDFASRLQIIDADLASCTNISSLRTQRVPSRHPEESLSHVLTILGGSHTLWNIAHAIYSKHYGNCSDSRDSGAWRFLQGLGIPCPNVVDKKDFTLMIKNMDKIHTATLVYCIKLVMGTEKENINDQLEQLPSKTINDLIDQTFDRFFSPEAKKASQGSAKLSNLILRLSDFASVVEGNAAMKAGDVGRLMVVWKRWAVISQGIKKLTQYSVQLPRMILLLNEVLPRGLAHIILHSLLIAPSGRQKHFVAKDQHLEQQNYWLKFFFNHGGRGADIDRLKNVYSVNITLLQNIISDLASDAGKVDIAQSHHNRIGITSLNNCLRMCRQNDVCSTVHKLGEYIPAVIDNFYALGIQTLKVKQLKKGKPINNLRPSTIGVSNSHNHLDNVDDDTDVSSAGDDEPEIDENGAGDENTEGDEQSADDGEWQDI
ncbi:uncharacterized protein PGTG_12052 [Puccinia graminis f. sp. tritici CRL 75-36-700-3]|uniref:DUF6589 domain-containing protein n=1 Tax=Puccinia graminis f. sp. tritici (strain CRL 75-36-700-3 / race SCCL) TaxID=418459 RepID=E3KP71_PUCGT|nr:uncharacterized protein PGTG_12052 [Puccinia graminis f. sp. tritici CRL 75-36-700-3]EFP86096.2 hypothetical protein PGTG_12052 [Puccinia graminis f. sp. tritici CRL 75-36-700-3]